jgi:hypothetical protein
MRGKDAFRAARAPAAADAFVFRAFPAALLEDLGA